MPRDGNQQYHRPVGTDGVPNTTIESNKYNTYILDVEQDLNYARPIVAGGTGATNVDVALRNLGAEKASQVITDFNSTALLAGSFYSQTSATAAPVPGHAFSGIVYGGEGTSQDLVVEARDRSDTGTPSALYIREKKGGVWGSWYLGSAVPAAQTMIESLVNNNIAINGNMEVLGDGTSGVAATSTPGAAFTTYYMENWIGLVTAGIPNAIGFAQFNFSVPDAPFGYVKSYTLTASSSAASIPAPDYVAILQNVEGWRINKLAWGRGTGTVPQPQPLSIGFWVKAVSAGPYSVLIRNHDGSASYALIYSINLPNVWEYHSFTIPAPPPTSVWRMDHQSAMTIIFCMAAGSGALAPPNAWASTLAVGAVGQMNGVRNSTDQLKITGLIMLPGTVVPAPADAPKAMRTYDQEVQLCRRYYQKHTRLTVDVNAASQTIILSPPMRVPPGITGGGAGFTVVVNDDGTTVQLYQTTRAWQAVVFNARL